jgi:hypothetical protein
MGFAVVSRFSKFVLEIKQVIQLLRIYCDVKIAKGLIAVGNGRIE